MADIPRGKFKAVFSAAWLTIALLQGTAPNAREIARGIDYAVDRGRIDSVEVAWHSQRASASPRVRRLAQATLHSYRYRFTAAERALLALRNESLGDAVARRAAFELARIQLSRGYSNAALPWLDRASREAWIAHDTLTAADVMLARASAVSSPAAVTALLDSATALGADHEPHFTIAPLCRRGGLLHGMGQHRRARELLHDGAERAKKAGLLRTEGRCRLALTVSFINTGETDSMRVQHFEVTRLATESGDLANLGSNLQWAATYLARLGRPALARSNLDSAFKLGRITGNDVIVAWSAYAYSDLDINYGDAKGAYAWATISDSLMRARADAFGIASIPTLHSRLAWLRSDYESVLRFSDSALAQAVRSGAPAAQFAALDEHRRAALRLGRVADAIKTQRQWQEMATRLQLRGYEAALNNGKAEIELWSGAHHRADSLFRLVGAALHPTQFALKHDVLMYRAHSTLLAGNIALAEQFGRDAGNEYVRWRSSLTDPDDRRRAAQSNKAFGDPYGLPRLIAELVKRGRAATAVELSEQRRAQLLRETLARRVAELPAAHNERIDVGPLQLAIPDRETAVLEYVLGVGDAPTTLIVVTRDTVAGFDLGPASGITASVARLTSRLEARQDARQVAAELATRILRPAQPLLNGRIKKLVIVPDGALHFVPFDALMLADNRYLVDDYEVSFVPSMTVAAQWWGQGRGRAPSRDLPSLVMGDPAYQRASVRLPFGLSLPSLGAEPLAFPRLPASAGEARTVARTVRGAELFLARDASEEQLRRRVGRDMRVLHIAAHAVVDDWSPDRSFIALAAGGGHDGIVSLADLASLDLRAQLIVLSGCRTARGEVIGGEGVQSLAQPFLEKGSRAVLATTWAVEDRHAAALVGRFYAALSRGATVGSALRSAKLELRRAGAPVSEWSAYTLLGDATLSIAAASGNR